jgi:hypothetical protein
VVLAVTLDNIGYEANRPSLDDYPIKRGLTVPAVALLSCLLLAVAVIAFAVWVRTR